MRYSPEQKLATRQRLIESGAALAKKEGFSNTGMDALMASAGLTTGAFYSQFRSKHELLHAIVEHELKRTLALFTDTSDDGLYKALAAYLSPYHAEHPEKGCPIPALGPEIGRADIGTRETFEALLVKLQASFRDTLGSDDAAWALICQAVGGVLVARAMATPERRSEVLASVLAHASDTLLSRQVL